MRHDVFISYASSDAHVAEAVCTDLERAGFPCWMAPRDVPLGGRWAGAISRAVEGSRRGFVLVLSASSGRSRHVGREVTLADESGVPILPYRVDTEAIGDDLKYYVANLHHVLAPDPLADASLGELRERVAAYALRGVVAQDAQEELPSVPVLSLKVENTTQLRYERGDTRVWDALRAFGRFTEEEIQRNGGRLVSLGADDDRLAVFETLEGAWNAASRIMESLVVSAEGAQADDLLRIGIGLDVGPVDVQGRTATGQGVLVASRLAERAAGRTILASEDFVLRLPPGFRARASFLDAWNLTGLAHPIDAFKLNWQPDAARPCGVTALVLEYGNVSVRVDEQNRDVVIGRKVGSDLQIPSRSVSREHAHVRWTHAGVWLQDVSTYGSVVIPTGEPETRVREGTIPLGREGTLRLGRDDEAGQVAIVRYQVPDEG